MKKWIALALALVLALSLMACGGKTGGTPEASAPAANNAGKASEAPAQSPASAATPAPTAAPAPTAEPTPEPTPEPTAVAGDVSGVVVDKDKDTVVITIPSDLVGDVDDQDEYIEGVMEEGITDVHFNEDGSVTYTMTREKHESMLKELDEQLDEALTSMVGDEETPAITKAEHTADYSEFSIFVDQERSDGTESFSAMALTMAGALYRAYAGEEDVNCTVRILDSETKEEISAITYEDWLAFLEALSSGFGDWEYEEEEPAVPLPEVEPTVLFDADGVTVTLEGLTSEYGSIKAVFTVVNNTENDISVDCRELYINDYQCYNGLYDTTPAGETITEEMYLSMDELVQAGVDCIGKLEICLCITDPESWEILSTGDLVEIRTSDYGKDWQAVPEGTVIYEDNGVSIRFLGERQDDFWGEHQWSYLFYYENTSDKRLCVSNEAMALNGVPMESWMSTDVNPGRRSVSVQSFYSSDFEEAELDSVHEMTVNFTIMDEDEWEEIGNTGDLSFAVESAGGVG